MDRNTIILCWVLLLKITFIVGQRTSLAVCEQDEPMTECLIEHISHKFEQLSGRISNEIRAGINQGSSGSDTDFDETNSRLDETNTNLDETNINLGETNTNLDETKRNLDETNTNLDETQNKLDETKTGLDETHSKLDETNTNLDETNSRLDETNSRLDTITARLNALGGQTMEAATCLPCSGQTNPQCETCPTCPVCDCSDPTTIADDNLPRNCRDIQNQGHTDSGIYTVYTHVAPCTDFLNTMSVNVYCDMETDGGGWLVFHKRFNGSVNFYHTSSSSRYTQGFGSLSGEFWLGLRNLYTITVGTAYSLRIDLQNWENERRYAQYAFFQIDDETSGFTVSLGPYSGDGGDAFSDVNHQQFRYRHCYVSGQHRYIRFWMPNDCIHLHGLNNEYFPDSTSEARRGMYWQPWLGNTYSLKSADMKIRPIG